MAYLCRARRSLLDGKKGKSIGEFMGKNIGKFMGKNIGSKVTERVTIKLDYRRALSHRDRVERTILLSFSIFVAVTVSFAWLPALFAQSKMTNLKGSNARPGKRVAWCHAVILQPTPSGQIEGNIGGQPFRPDVVQWNSYSVTLKQSKKRYCKVVVNMMRSQKPLCNLAFTSDTNKRPHIYVYSRSSHAQPVLEQHYTAEDGYGLKLALLSPLSDDSVPGSLSLRLPDGSFVAGTFKAEKAPRIIWDDQTVDSK